MTPKLHDLQQRLRGYYRNVEIVESDLYVFCYVDGRSIMLAKAFVMEQEVLTVLSYVREAVNDD